MEWFETFCDIAGLIPSPKEKGRVLCMIMGIIDCPIVIMLLVMLIMVTALICFADCYHHL